MGGGEVNPREEDRQKHVFNHIKLEVTRWWLVSISPLYHPQFHASLPDSPNQNSIEGDGCVNLLESKEITTETVSNTQR